jgi:hypothetical protein
MSSRATSGTPTARAWIVGSDITEAVSDPNGGGISRMDFDEDELRRNLESIKAERKRRYPTEEAYDSEIERVTALLATEFVKIGEPPPDEDERLAEMIVSKTLNCGCTIEEAVRDFVGSVIAIGARYTGGWH